MTDNRTFQEKQVPIKIAGIPVASVFVRRYEDGEVSITIPDRYADVNFQLIAEEVLGPHDKLTGGTVLSGPVSYRTDSFPPVPDPTKKFRTGEMGLNGL